MKVRVKSGKLRLSFWLPPSLVGIGLKILVKKGRASARSELKENAAPFDKVQIKELVKAIKSAKKIHGRLEILNVQSKDEESVVITL